MGEDVKKRRLPSWMMSSSSSIAIVVVENKEPSSVIETQEEEEEGGGKRKQARRATATAPPTPTKKPKTRTRRRRRRRHHSSSSSDEEDEDPVSLALEEEEEDDQLTVDDLITIAQEYVKADDARAKQNEVTVEPNSRNTIPSTSRKEKEKLQEVRTGPDSEEPTETTSLTFRNSSSSTFGVEVLPTLASVGPSSKLANMKDGEHLPMRETIYNSYKTGDPAQDMLDLFLGPLLNKPKIELMKHEKETAFEYGLEKPSQKEETGKQLPPLTKKKSSLRDKVAMFLD